MKGQTEGRDHSKEGKNASVQYDALGDCCWVFLYR